MGVALGLACSVPALQGKRSKGHGVQTEKQRSRFAVFQDFGQNSGDTHHSAIKSKEYDLESKDNNNDLIVLRLFARFHMADK